jgi:CHAT domain-containing protein
VTPAAGEDMRAAGEALRTLVLDPVLAAAGDASTLYLCLDDSLHLIPPDALPLGHESVGDRVAIRIQPSFERLIRRSTSPGGEPSLLTIGGIDYGAKGDAIALRGAGLVASASSGIPFPSLAATRAEAQAIADAFKEAHGRSAVMLEAGAATKAQFSARAPSARYLHLATHGYFSEALGSAEEERRRASQSGLWSGASMREVAHTLSPMVLCGLALAGANGGYGSRGRAEGILTAEELAGLDLRICELAVLSACETNVGKTRAGLGISSLQAALHAAGVRTAITSPWKVPDERTRELMVDFYRRLWLEKRPVADALWQAKKAARAEGWPLRDWAAWVLTGDPGDEIPSPTSRAASAPAVR